MDYEREYDLEDAGIDAFDFSLMNEDERREALNEAGLDPDDYEDIEFEDSFTVWSDLQASGVKLWELNMMDDGERRAALRNAGISPDAFDDLSVHYKRTSFGIRSPAPPRKNSAQEPPKRYQFCNVRFEHSDKTYSYLADGFYIHPGDLVEVPVGNCNDTKIVPVISVGVYTKENAPYPIEKAKSILRRVMPGRPLQETSGFSEKEGQHRYTETEHSDYDTHRIKAASVILTVGLLFVIGVFVSSRFGMEAIPVASKQITGPSATLRPTTTPKSSQTTKPTPTVKPTTRPTLKPAATTKPRASSSGGPSIGTKLSRDDGLYFLGGGGTIDGVSTTKFRYYYGSQFYVVYLDSNYVVKKVEDYLPGSKSKGKSNEKKDSKKKKSTDPYNASDYLHPDDFYYDYYDDFWDYEDAEDYWEKHH